jgi:hypothetical protein
MGLLIVSFDELSYFLDQSFVARLLAFVSGPIPLVAAYIGEEAVPDRYPKIYRHPEFVRLTGGCDQAFIMRSIKVEAKGECGVIVHTRN